MLSTGSVLSAFDTMVVIPAVAIFEPRTRLKMTTVQPLLNDQWQQ